MEEKRTSPSCYDFIRALDNRITEYSLTLSERMIYHTLLMINNRKHWPDWFRCTDAYLTGFMKMGVTSMKNARNKLKQNEMIDFVTSKKGENARSIEYAMSFAVCFVHIKSTYKQITNLILKI